MISRIAALILLLTAAPAAAWEFEDEGGVCSVGQAFDGPGNTLLLFGQSPGLFENGDRVLIALSNENWSIEPGEALGTVRFETETGWFQNSAIGGAASYGGTVQMSVSFEHFSQAMGSYASSLEVSRNGTVIDRLNLSGITGAYLQFAACRREKVAEKNERERLENLERILPLDPFSDGNPR